MVEKCLDDTDYVKNKEDFDKIISNEFIKEIKVWIHCLRLLTNVKSSEVIKSFHGILKAIWRVIHSTLHMTDDFKYWQFNKQLFDILTELTQIVLTLKEKNNMPLINIIEPVKFIL